MKAVFSLASKIAPSVVFVDEVGILLYFSAFLAILWLSLFLISLWI